MTEAIQPSSSPEPLPRRLWVLAGLAALTTGAGLALKPAQSVKKDKATDFDLEKVVPRQFGTWKELPMPVQAVNPQTQEILDRIYSQTLGRSYVNDSGYMIMLALSYGADQRGTMEAHMPEVCYPAQGFKVHSNQPGQLSTPQGSIAVKRLNTQMASRVEPLTYWFTIGSTNVQSRVDKRIAELRMSLTGQIPDGLLFRVSSIDEDTQRAWRMQEAFVNDLLRSVPAATRVRLAGV
jgi:EpsI family protein